MRTILLELRCHITLGSGKLETVNATSAFDWTKIRQNHCRGWQVYFPPGPCLDWGHFISGPRIHVNLECDLISLKMQSSPDAKLLLLFNLSRLRVAARNRFSIIFNLPVKLCLSVFQFQRGNFTLGVKVIVLSRVFFSS